MRILLPLAVAALALLAGCVTPDTNPTTPTNGSTNTTADMAALPPAINDTKEVQGGAEPISGLAGPACSTPGAKCFRYPFQLNGTAHVLATLTWGVPASDFDLFIYKDGKPTDLQSACCTPPQPHSEKIDADLEAGSYEVVVSAASVAQDTYKLSATFTAASGA